MCLFVSLVCLSIHAAGLTIPMTELRAKIAIEISAVFEAAPLMQF